VSCEYLLMLNEALMHIQDWPALLISLQSSSRHSRRTTPTCDRLICRVDDISHAANRKAHSAPRR
jgi:hypothetical protein